MFRNLSKANFIKARESDGNNVLMKLKKESIILEDIFLFQTFRL